MLFCRAVLPFAATALLLIAPALAQQGPGCSPRGFLTPEQRLMQFADMQKATGGKPEALHAFREQQRDKMRAMTEAERQVYAASLTKRWNALSVAQQSKLKEQAEAFRAQHPMMGGRGGDRCPSRS